MSVNINMYLSVTELANREQADKARQALRAILEDHGIVREVTLDLETTEDGKYAVKGTTPYPLIISRSYLWCPEFEKDVKTIVANTVATASVEVDWDYPDEE